MSVPEWVQDAIFYQIFPDRFANGDLTNDPPNVYHWGSPPTSWGFQGGDLQGIIQKFDYLLDLGINAIYLNPIFQASSNHRYNTQDYYSIDPKLGTLTDFHDLISLAHRHHVRVILDGVFNHCGRGFFAFNDILENQEYSGYRDWFHINCFPIDAYSWGEASDYMGWWGMKSLPKFNTGNPRTRKYLLEVAKHWIKLGADGWRLDVPNEINDDAFWDEFRQAVKSANPEAYLVGEIWMPDTRWVGDKHFDGLMNYPVMDALVGFLGTQSLKADQFAEKVESLHTLYPPENGLAMYVPIGSHDTERILTRLGNDTRRAKLAYTFQFAYPGAPAIYYGDEIGLVGGKDPACRGAFIWDEASWNIELHDFIKSLVKLRKEHQALRRGEFLHLGQGNSPEWYAFARVKDEDKVLVAMNASSEQVNLSLDVSKMGWKDGSGLKNLLKSGQAVLVNQQKVDLRLAGWEGAWLG